MDRESLGSREVRLLENERVWMILESDEGLLADVPPEGDCLVLTNERVVELQQSRGRRRSVFIPLASVASVEVVDTARSPKPLYQGVLTLLGAVVLLWLATAFGVLNVLSWLIIGTIVLLAAVTASGYFAAEGMASMSFRAQDAQAGLPLRTSRARQDAYSMASEFFKAKAGRGANPPPVREYLEIPRTEAEVPQQPSQEPHSEDPAASLAVSMSTAVSAQGQGRQDVQVPPVP